jgi:hypothetical protein
MNFEGLERRPWKVRGVVTIFTGGTGYKASTILASQEVMKLLILNSDGNVVVQTYNHPHISDSAGATDVGRLYCQKCKAAKLLNIEVFLNENKFLAELEWAKDHKHPNCFTVHDVEAQVPNGERKLKVVF